MRFLVAIAAMLAVAAAQDEFYLTEPQKKNLRLGLCPGFTLEACLPDRIEADKSLPPCDTNEDCVKLEMEGTLHTESFCCPSKCGGMRCLPYRKNSAVELDGCIVPSAMHLLENCERIGYECTPECKCCLDVDFCARKCVD